jgi:glutamyl-tRNA synthetase
MKSDLRWLGLDWDEGPDVDDQEKAPHGPYRQSERAALYQALVSRLVAEGKAYPCFCTDAELEAMKAEAEEKKLAPIYRGKWATASKEEVEEELKKGTPCCYRFRVPPGEEVAIDDAVRGRVSWSTDTLGDFVVLRSNGLPVYNFCVAVDDALMRVTDVLRAEEHLPNTLRQVLVYRALGFATPRFAHMSLILAPDRSKLSKRHGATSVGEFRQQGYLPAAMVNYLALLGWNDGTEQEVFSSGELSARFSVERITKSPAVFDRTKLSWMNGQHLRALPEKELESVLIDALSGGEGSGGEAVLSAGGACDAAFASAVASLVKGSVDVLTEAAPQVRAILDYPLEQTAAEAEKAFVAVRDDGFGEIVRAVLAAADSGELAGAAEAGARGDGGEAYKNWAKAVGKATGRKGKRLFMPLRVALTGRTQGPDVGDVVAALARCDAGRDLAAGVAFVPLGERVAALRAWASKEGML